MAQTTSAAFLNLGELPALLGLSMDLSVTSTRASVDPGGPSSDFPPAPLDLGRPGLEGVGRRCASCLAGNLHACKIRHPGMKAVGQTLH